jgi:hypothetical protein
VFLPPRDLLCFAPPDFHLGRWPWSALPPLGPSPLCPLLCATPSRVTGWPVPAPRFF